MHRFAVKAGKIRPRLAVPGIALCALLVTTLAFNLLGDSVRDAFDPRGAEFLAGGEG